MVRRGIDVAADTITLAVTASLPDLRVLSRLVVSISMTAASIAELARSCRRRQVLDRGCPIIAETAADRMAGGAGSPVTPTFLRRRRAQFVLAYCRFILMLTPSILDKLR